MLRDKLTNFGLNSFEIKQFLTVIIAVIEKLNPGLLGDSLESSF